MSGNRETAQTDGTTEETLEVQASVEHNKPIEKVLPRPREDESEQEFVSRCVSRLTEMKEGKDQKQRLGMCYSLFRNNKDTEKGRDGNPLSDVERAKRHHNLSDEEWEALSDEEKQRLIGELPPRGTAKTPSILNPAFMIRKADDRFIIGGYANVYMMGEDGEVIPDRQRETVTLEALDEALQLLMAKESRRNHLYWHSNIQIGELIWDATDSEGTLWKTHVVYEPSEQYPKKGLFVLSDVFTDTPPSINAIKQMEKGSLLEFSIGGIPLAKESKCDSDKCWTEITKLYLGEVSSCEMAVNRESKAFVLKALRGREVMRTTCDMTPSQLSGIMHRLDELEKALKH